MTATLFNHEALALVERAIENNQREAATLFDDVMQGDPDAVTRWHALNLSWHTLLTARHELTGEDPAPFRMGRA